MSEQSSHTSTTPSRREPSNVPRLDTRRLGAFLVVAFGIAWAGSLVIYLTGGLASSPVVVPALGLTLASVLLPTVVMFAPAAGNLAARAVTGQGWDDLRLRPRFRRGWRFYLVAWFGPIVLTLLGAALFFAVFPQYFDPSLQALGLALRNAGAPISPWLYVGIQLVLALVVGATLNALFAFGEEFGWRAYLLYELLPLGRRRAIVTLGVVWGIWHWPIIAMGYNYGTGYVGAPWTGMAAMLVMTTSVGTFLAWVTLRTDSVWPAAIGHGTVNAIAAIGILFVKGNPPSLLGPTVVGLVAIVPWALVAVWLLANPTRFGPLDRSDDLQVDAERSDTERSDTERSDTEIISSRAYRTLR